MTIRYGPSIFYCRVKRKNSDPTVLVRNGIEGTADGNGASAEFTMIQNIAKDKSVVFATGATSVLKLSADRAV